MRDGRCTITGTLRLCGRTLAAMERPHSVSIYLSLAALFISLGSLFVGYSGLQVARKGAYINEKSARPFIAITSLKIARDITRGADRAHFIITASNLGKTVAENVTIALRIVPIGKDGQEAVRIVGDVVPHSDVFLRGPIVSGTFAPGLIRSVPFEALFSFRLPIIPELTIAIFGRNSYYSEGGGLGVRRFIDDWCFFKPVERDNIVRQGDLLPCTPAMESSFEAYSAHRHLSE